MTKLKLHILLLSVFSLCLIYNTALAQQNIPSDLSNVSVNDLSDIQIRQLLQQADNNGLTDTELYQMAEDRGLPPSQIGALKNRIKQIRNTSGTSNNYNDSISTNADTATGRSRRTLNYRSADTSNYYNKKDNYNRDVFNTILPNIFGADIFRNANSTFAPNLKLATPKNYIVGPEDQLNVNVYGSSVANWKLEVSPEGNINIPVAGILNVSGKTIEQVTEDIKRKLITYHFAVGNGTSVQVTLGNIRSINVIIIGYVRKPGTYTLPSLATAFNALYAAGGPSDKGTFRQIQIIRNNKIIRTLDVYDFLINGDQRNNINLQDQDIIKISPFGTHVEMAGEVNNPAIFEVLPGETLQDVIKFAGGFTDHAYTNRIKIYQVSEGQRQITDIKESNYKSYIPARGDKYIVDRILNRFKNRVAINGAVFRPGDYELENGLTVAQLIDKAGGLKEDAFTGNGSITRLNPDNSKRMVSFNVGNILNKSAADVPLQREDSVYISSLFDLHDKYTVSIKGDVRKPGVFAYADSMNVTDLIIKAGGFIEGGNAKRIQVAQRKNDNAGGISGQIANVYTVDLDPKLNLTKADFVLHPYDIVSVYSLPDYEKQRTVTVEGEVSYPGYYVLQTQNEKISDVIRRAGYLKPLADPTGSTLRRTNSEILGVDKNKTDKADSMLLVREREEHLKHLQRSFKDSSTVDNEQSRNNYIGINLVEILKKPGSPTDLILEDGDVLRIPKQQQVVKINGEVLYPSAVVYIKDKDFKDYVLNAGGFSPRALKRGAYIVYANGAVKGTRKFLFFNSYPSVKPGSEIYVPQKPPPNLNSAQLAIGLTTGVASLGAIILGILSLHR
jgi:protein involved in polysaccharide export with SLBB domain